MNTAYEGTWRPLTVGAGEMLSLPSPRAGHSLDYDYDLNLSISFGGASHEEGLNSDTYVLDHGILYKLK
jgi:hypothetical protein